MLWILLCREDHNFNITALIPYPSNLVSTINYIHFNSNSFSSYEAPVAFFAFFSLLFELFLCLLAGCFSFRPHKTWRDEMVALMWCFETNKDIRCTLTHSTFKSRIITMKGVCMDYSSRRFMNVTIKVWQAQWTASKINDSATLNWKR